jgi:hypothetical protein
MDNINYLLKELEGMGTEQLWPIADSVGEHSSVDGWGAMLQAGKLKVWVPKRLLIFFNEPILSSCTMALGFTEPLTEMSTRRNFWG